MMKHLLLLLLFIPTLALAKVELFQIVVFNWDDSTNTLQLVSLGSGTSVGDDLILTNKHVVQTGEGEFADLIVLCQAKARAGNSVDCNIAAGVSAVHAEEDVALVRPIEDQFFPKVRRSFQTKRAGDQVRVHGFPTPSGRLGFGDTKTVEGFKAWAEDPSKPLKVSGDKLTVTRGKVTARLINERTNFTYTQTDAKVNFGNSGGAVFDEFGDYLGIVTLKDQEDNSIFIEYHQIDDWVETHSDRAPRYEVAAYQFYQSATVERATAQPASSQASSLVERLRALRAKQTQPSNSTTIQNTTTRKLTPTQQRLYDYLRQKRAQTSGN